jgi:hypothetical protein
MNDPIIKNFLGFLKDVLNEDSSAANPGDLSAEVKFNFNFESGKYEQADIPAASLTQLKTDLNKPIGLIRVPKYLNQKTTLTLVASTSKLGLGQDLKAKLQAAGYQITGNGNAALCQARLKTLESITVSYFCERLGCSPEELKKKIEIKQVSRPNSGGEANASDEERKKYQYVSMSLTQTGDAIPDNQKITCNMKPASRQGGQANQSNNYVGYNQDQIVVVPVGNLVTLTFDPMTVPDMVYFKYKETEFLSPWLGSTTRTTVYDATTGKNSTIDASDPRYRDFEKELNDPAKCPGLKDAINKEIAAVGGKLTVETALAKNGGYVNNRFEVQPGPNQQGAKNVNFTFAITKGFDLDNLTIRVFSPLAGTSFSISSVCSPGKTT